MKHGMAQFLEQTKGDENEKQSHVEYLLYSTFVSDQHLLFVIGKLNYDLG